MTRFAPVSVKINHHFIIPRDHLQVLGGIFYHLNLSLLSLLGRLLKWGTYVVGVVAVLIAIHVHLESFNHLTNRSVFKLRTLAQYILRNSFPHQKFTSHVGEMIAVVLENVILLESELILNVFDELLEILNRDFSFSNLNFLQRISKLSCLWLVKANSS